MAKPEKLYMYLLESITTGKLYLSPENVCSISLTETDAPKMIERKEGVRIAGPKRYTMDDIASICYAIGADKIRFYKDGATMLKPLLSTGLIMAPYNHLTNQLICRAKQEGDASILMGLAEGGYFFVPVRIDQKDAVDIYYGTAKRSQDTESCFVCFSTIEEYRVWASNHTGYSPLKISYRSLRQIAGTHGWIINPQGNQLIMQEAFLSQIDRRLKDA